MPLSQANVTANTPMGATLVPGGATFKAWAPGAIAVYLKGTFGDVTDWSPAASPMELTRDVAGYWAGFLPGVADGDEYNFYVVGPSGGGSGFKRDPYARELTASAIVPGGRALHRPVAVDVSLARRAVLDTRLRGHDRRTSFMSAPTRRRRPATGRSWT